MVGPFRAAPRRPQPDRPDRCGAADHSAVAGLPGLPSRMRETSGYFSASCRRIRSASFVEKPGRLASSAAVADLTPARLPKRSSRRPTAGRPDPGDLEQFRGNSPLGTTLPVVGHSKAMRLIPRSLQADEVRGFDAGAADCPPGPGERPPLLVLARLTMGIWSSPGRCRRLDRRRELALSRHR